MTFGPPCICNEFVQLVAKEVTTKIANEVKKAKYFSITVNSTPDVTHEDQLNFIIRYVQDDGTIVERFLKFMDSNGQHDAESITNRILRTLTKYDINLGNCCDQSYDHWSNLSGKNTGVQARLNALNPLIRYIPCSAVSLNLIGSCAAESCINAVLFFGFLQNFYKFFSASTKRWAKIKSAIKEKIVKSLSNTKSSARLDATTVLKENFVELRQLLQNFTLDENETNETKSESSYLKKSMNALEKAILRVLWHKIFQRFHSTSKSLQRADMSFGSCVALYNEIESFCQHLRNEFDTIEKNRLKLVYRKPMCLKANATEKRRRLLIMKRRTLDALELWMLLVNSFVLELTFQLLIP